MGSTKINVGAVIGLGPQLQRVNSVVSSVRTDLYSTKNHIDGRILNRNNLSNRMQSAFSQLAAIENRIGRIKGTAERGANSYRDTDNLVVSWKNAIADQFPSRASSGGNAAFFQSRISSKQDSEKKTVQEKTANDSSPWSWSDTWKMVGSAGIIGSVFSTIGGLITGGISVSNGLSTAKGAAKAIENIAKAVPKNSTSSFDWKTLFGFNSTTTKYKTFGKIFGESIEKLKFGNAKTVSDKIAVGAKWAGYGLTAISTFYENFTDTTENNSTGRKIAESIGETAVTIGEGLVIGAAVTTAFAAASIGPAVVAVGAITVGVTWAVDWLSEKVTGKDFAEFVSDSVLDFGEAAIKSVGKTAKKVSGAITGWWKKTFR